MTVPTGVTVLTNVLELVGNPYLRLWNDACRRTGATVSALSARAVVSGWHRGSVWVHLQWPERVLQRSSALDAGWRMTKLLGLVAIGRLRGAHVLLTVHNVWSHAQRHPRLERILWRVLSRLTTDLHLLAAAGAEDVFGAHPGLRRARCHVIPHGDYTPLLEDAPDRAAARAAHGFDDELHVFLTFGVLTSYKGIEDLLDAFSRHDDPDARLVVAGQVGEPALGARLGAAAEQDARMVLVPGFVGDAELAQLIRASDCVVLPYRRILNSGSAILALTLGRPVVLPRTPTFDELAVRAGPAWVVRFTGRIDADDLARAPRRPPAGRPDLGWCSWERVTESIAALWAAGRGPARAR